MIRIVRHVAEVRAWVEQRGGRPCRRPDGGLDLNLPGEPCRGIDVAWGEFEPNFCVAHYALAFDDAPGSRAWFLGREHDVERLFAASRREGGPGAPGRNGALDRASNLG